MEKLLKIQKELKAPKNQYNKFGGYRYRSCEDILEAVKPLLYENNLTLILSDELVNIGNRFYIKATAFLYDGDKLIASTSAYAREAEKKTGMDEAQITGAASSYARKYALNALFLIDDAKDMDTEEYQKTEEEYQKAEEEETEQKPATIKKEPISDAQKGFIKSFAKNNQWKDSELLHIIKNIIGRSISSIDELTKAEASKVITKLKEEPF